MHRKPGARRRWLRRLLWVGVALVALSGLAVLALVWRLHRGPIGIDFLQPRIEQALDELIAPVSVKLGGTTIHWVGGGRPLEVLATDVEIVNLAGDTLASFAEVGIGLYGPLLLRGEPAPTALVFRNTQAVLTRSEDGSFEFGLGDTAAAPADAEPDGGLKDLLDSWLEPKDPDSPLARLAKISIVDSRLSVHDLMLGVDWGADPVDLSLTRQDGVLKARASLSLDVGDRKSPLTADATYAVSDGRLTVGIGFSEIVPSAFAGSYPGLEPLRTLDDPLSGTIDLTLADASRVHAKLELRGEPGAISGTVEVTDEYSSFVGTLEVKQLDPRAFAGVLPELAQLSRIPFTIDGQVQFAIADEGLKSLGFDLTGGSGKLAVAELYSAPLVLGGTRLKGSIVGAGDEIRIERAEVKLQDLQLTARLSARRRGEAYRGTLEARVGQAAAEQVGKYWPPEFGTDAREWVLDHVTTGTLTDIELDMAAAVTLKEPIGFDLRSLKTTFGFTGLSVDALAPQPPITGIDGRATISTARLDFDVEQGQLGGMEIATTKIAIDLAGDGPAELSLDLAAGGPLDQIATLLDDRPLELVPDDLLAGLGGQAEFELQLRMPLAGDIDRQAIRTSARAQLRDVVWRDSPVPLGDRTIRDGDLALTLDDDSLDVRGTLKLSGIPARVELWQNLTGGEPARRVVSHLRVDDAARTALGLPEQEYWSGATQLELTYVGHRDGSSGITAAGDLTGAVLEIPEMKWNKPAGVAGRASIVAELPEQGPWRVEQFDVSAGELTTSGSFELDPDPVARRRLRIDRFALPGTEIHGTLSFDASTGYRIRIEGPRFDAVPVIDYLKTRNAEPAGPSPDGAAPASTDRAALDLDVRLDQLSVTDTSAFHELTARASFDGETLQRLDIRAAMKPKSVISPEADDEARAEVEPGVDTKFEVNHAPDGSGHQFVFETDNLGGLVEALHVSTALNAGNAKLTARRETPDGPWTGNVQATHFTLLEAPALARLLQLGSIRGIATAFSKEGLWFKKVEVGLTFHDGRLGLERGKALGKGFAITAEGFIDLDKHDAGLTGAVTPMATVQKVIGHIPLIGRLLTGWHREGIIAFLYSVKGALPKPKINVKKFSALTPGITREIYKLAPDGSKKKKKKKKQATGSD